MSEQLIGKIDTYVFGIACEFRSKRFALTLLKDKKASVDVDGKPGKLYDGIGNNSVVFSNDGVHIAYAAKREMIGIWFWMA